MSHIFISYSRKDSELVEKIVDALTEDNLKPWLDWKSIPKGEEVQREIHQAIEEADIFLFFVSPDSVQSKWCIDEIEHAAQNYKRILPIIIRDTDPKVIHPEISKRNWICCRDGQDDFNKAIEETHETINTDYEWLKYHTELQVKALKWEQKKDTSRLLRGKELREAKKQITETSIQENPQPTKLQYEYILASQRNEFRIRRLISIGVISIIVITVALSIIAIENTKIARAGELVAQAQAEIEREPDLAILLSLEAYQRENIWNTRNGLFTVLQSNTAVHPIEKFLSGHSEYANYIAFSPDGTILASGSQDATIKLWNVATGEPIHLPLIGHEGGVTCLAFSPDGTILASGSWDQSIRLWNVETGKTLGKVLTEHTGGIISLAYSSDGKTLISSSEDNTVRLWSFAYDPPTSQLLVDGSHVLSVAFSPDGKTLAMAGEENMHHSIRLWDAKSYKEQGAPLLGHSDWITTLAFSPDSKTLASGSADQSIRVWDVGTHQQSGIPFTGFTDWVSSVAFSPDGKFLVSGSWDRSIRLWDLTDHRPLGYPIMEHRSWVTGVAISPDGKIIASSSKDNTLRLWPLGPAGWAEVSCERSQRNLTHSEWAQYFANEPYHPTCPQWGSEP